MWTLTLCKMALGIIDKCVKAIHSRIINYNKGVLAYLHLCFLYRSVHEDERKDVHEPTGIKHIANVAQRAVCKSTYFSRDIRAQSRYCEPVSPVIDRARLSERGCAADGESNGRDKGKSTAERNHLGGRLWDEDGPY